MSTENVFDPKLYVGKKGQIISKYINNITLMLDVVGFSKEMTNSKMIKIVTGLQTSMHEVLDSAGYYWAEKKKKSTLNNFILVPTGDGYGISLNPALNDQKILTIASDLSKRFRSEEISVRMGIAKGYNIVAVDLNDNLNVFGYGIVLATRICNAALPGQILIEDAFAESLNQNQKIPELKKITKEFTAKHDFKFCCHNYYKPNEFGIMQEE